MTTRKDANNKKNAGRGNNQDDYWRKKQELEKQGKKLFKQTIFKDWCKSCGICVAFCPKAVFTKDKHGRPVIEKPDACNGCLFCELHCPDFAISIQECYPDRRRRKNNAS